MRIWALCSASVLLIILAITAGLRFGFSMNPAYAPIAICCAKDKPLTTVSYGLLPKETYDSFYDALAHEDDAEKGVLIRHNGARSAIVAHHLIVGKEIARVFETIGDDSVKQVILISPNHFNAGRSPAITAPIEWTTPYGNVKTDTTTEAQLVRAGVVQEDLGPFQGEHGINSVTPFVKRSFPNAQIIPLIIHESLSADSAQKIAEQLNRIAPNAIVIASIDMSHNLPLTVQQFHDKITELTLESGELKEPFSPDQAPLEIDSNQGLSILFALNKLRGTQTWNETYHNSSLNTGVAQQWIDNTSHILGYFAKGEPKEQSWTSFLFMGDIMLDRGTRKQILDAKPEALLGDPTYPWRNLKRFSMGTDVRIANLEGTVNEQPSSYTYDPPFRFVFDPTFVKAMKPYVDIVSLANNHAADVGAGKGQEETHTWLNQLGIPWFGKWETPSPAYDFEIHGTKYRIIGYHAFQPDEETLMKLIKEGKSQNRFVIVVPHWGVEYEHDPFSGQTYLAQQMANAGADLIVGGHPHVVQGIDITHPSNDAQKQVPVIYSLGNFVFDQRIPETWDATALGFIHTKDSLMLYFLPIGTKNSQPVPYGGEDAARVLRVIANASPQSLRDAILQSTITIPYASKETKPNF